MATETPRSDIPTTSPIFVPGATPVVPKTGAVPTDQPSKGALGAASTADIESRSNRQQVTIEDTDPRLCPADPAKPMLKKSLPNVLPLHLAPIDQFFCDDDTREFPMTSVIHMDFTGQVEPSAFEGALEDALARHPLLGCNVKPAKRNLPCWVKSEQQMPWIDWGDSDNPLTVPHILFLTPQ